MIVFNSLHEKKYISITPRRIKDFVYDYYLKQGAYAYHMDEYLMKHTVPNVFDFNTDFNDIFIQDLPFCPDKENMRKHIQNFKHDTLAYYGINLSMWNIMAYIKMEKTVFEYISNKKLLFKGEKDPFILEIVKKIIRTIDTQFIIDHINPNMYQSLRYKKENILQKTRKERNVEKTTYYYGHEIKELIMGVITKRIFVSSIFDKNVIPIIESFLNQKID